MDCDRTQQTLLDLDLDEARRAALREALAHIDGCASCRSAMGDYDLVRASLKCDVAEAEPPAGWPTFESRLAQIAARGRRRRMLLPMALAASLLAAFTGWTMYLQKGPIQLKPANGTQRDNLVVSLSPEEISERVQVFDQVASVFDRRVGWVLIGGQSSDLGLFADAADATGKLLVLGLAASHDRSLVSRADLIIVPGQSASVTVPSDKGPTLRYHVTTSPGTPTRLRLWVEAQQPSEAGVAQAALATDLDLMPGRVTSVGQMVTPAGRYDVNVTLANATVTRHQA